MRDFKLFFILAAAVITVNSTKITMQGANNVTLVVDASAVTVNIIQYNVDGSGTCDSWIGLFSSPLVITLMVTVLIQIMVLYAQKQAPGNTQAQIQIKTTDYIAFDDNDEDDTSETYYEDIFLELGESAV